MRLSVKNIYRLGIKELRSLYRDPVMLFMILWAFSASIYIAGTSISHDLHNASIAIVDEDQSPLSLRIRSAFEIAMRWCGTFNLCTARATGGRTGL